MHRSGTSVSSESMTSGEAPTVDQRGSLVRAEGATSGDVMVSNGRAGFGAALRVREFRSLWAAELLSVAGDQLARLALAVLVFARTSSARLTALTYALTFIPAVLGGALLSGLADRFSRRRILVVADLVRAGLAGAMALPGLS